MSSSLRLGGVSLPQPTTSPVPPKLRLYSYFRSSCAWRVRIALNLKGLEYEYKAVNLLREQFSPELKKLNPLGFVPVLVDGDVVVADSFAIVMIKPLLPQDPKLKAINIQAASVVGSGIQPLQNHSVLKFIEDKINATEKDSWVHHHIGKGFAALDERLKSFAGKYATGDEVYMADLFLAPQIYAAIHRFQIDMSRYPLLSRLNDAHNELPEFQAAMPAMHPDAPKS